MQKMLTALLLMSLAATRPTPLPYPQTVAALEERRQALALRFEASPVKARAAVLASARVLAFSAITEEILPAWYGTPWAFYGTSEVPGHGTIACGYFVTTVLRDAGFRIERERLAQLASERVVKTFAAPSEILRFRGASPADVLEKVRSGPGDGIYVVGMDYHVALLVLDGKRADLCHSAVLPPQHVVCEPALDSPGFQSDYRVIGPVLSTRRLTDWLEGTAITTAH